MMATTRPTELHQRRVRLTREPAAAAEARSHVRAVIGAWRVPVDPDIAVLLTSDLVTNAIMHGDGNTITLAIRCSCGELRIDIYDASRSLPRTVGEPAVTETGHGLVLVATLSTEWGSFLTPAGKVVYFTLAFQADLSPGSDHAAAGDHTRDRKQGAPFGSSSPLVAHSGRAPTREGVTWKAFRSGVRTNGRVRVLTGSRVL